MAGACRDLEVLRFDYRGRDGDATGTPTGSRCTPRTPPDDAARHVARGTGSLAWPHPARVRLHASAEAVAERISPAGGLLRPVDTQSCVLETGAGSLRDLVGCLTALDIGFEVLDPPELRALLREPAERYAAAAGPPVSRRSG